MRHNPRLTDDGVSEWTFSTPNFYPAYATALQKLAVPGCAVAHVTAMWSAVLEKKPYLCLTDNGLNHANDFGDRLYADVVLAAIGGEVTGWFSQKTTANWLKALNRGLCGFYG